MNLSTVTGKAIRAVTPSKGAWVAMVAALLLVAAAAAPAVAVIITGTAADDELEGTAAADQIRGKDGSDTIWGYGGDDFLVGGHQHDHLFGGPGADELWDGIGRDFLYGGPGNDILSGNSRENLSGGLGADRLQLFGGRAWGNDGNDFIRLEADTDTTAFAGAGEDHVRVRAPFIENVGDVPTQQISVDCGDGWDRLDWHMDNGNANSAPWTSATITNCEEIVSVVHEPLG